MKPFECFNDIVVERKNVRVTLEWIGEGMDGDYHPEDEEDYPHLRFTVAKYENGEWMDIDDASYCTLLNARADRAVLRYAAEFLLNEVEELVNSGTSIKKLCERLSWIGENSIAVIQSSNVLIGNLDN